MVLDTSGLLCLFDRRQPQHAEAVREYEAGHEFLTHSYVLAELLPLALSRGLGHAVSLRTCLEVLDDPEVVVVFVDEPLHRRALDLLAQRPDKSYSLCDAVSFVLMRDRAVTDALTTDHHSEQEGFTRLLDA